MPGPVKAVIAILALSVAFCAMMVFATRPVRANPICQPVVAEQFVSDVMGRIRSGKLIATAVMGQKLVEFAADADVNDEVELIAVFISHQGDDYLLITVFRHKNTEMVCLGAPNAAATRAIKKNLGRGI